MSSIKTTSRWSHTLSLSGAELRAEGNSDGTGTIDLQVSRHGTDQRDDPGGTVTICIPVADWRTFVALFPRWETVDPLR
jgi:hypothetical protein